MGTIRNVFFDRDGELYDHKMSPDCVEHKFFCFGDGWRKGVECYFNGDCMEGMREFCEREGVEARMLALHKGERGQGREEGYDWNWHTHTYGWMPLAVYDDFITYMEGYMDRKAMGSGSGVK